MSLTKRNIILNSPAYLHLKDLQLKIINKDKQEIGSIPIEDIALLILDNSRITITHALIELLLENNSAIIFCDEKHLPNGLILNLNKHSIQAERFKYQIKASESLKKHLWKQTIYQKVENQAAVLKILNKDVKRLNHLLTLIESGDSTNVEGRAAAYYWKTLLGKKFIRDRFGTFPNSHLNYAYAILRATVARALVSSGLLPTFGIFHSNKYNSYALADDIMEPYRPFIDLLVVKGMQQGFISDNEITKEEKSYLLEFETITVKIRKRRSPIMAAISSTTSSLAECFEGTKRKIVYPNVYDKP
ncbi:MAG: type II CRISPR-associated endonuclease Cas1 [Bacteroidales bacterium]